MNKEIAHIPHVTLRLRSSAISETNSALLHLQVVLDGHISHKERSLIEDVLEQLKNGLLLGTENLNTEITKILREEVESLREENHRLTGDLLTSNLKLDAYRAGILPDTPSR